MTSAIERAGYLPGLAPDEVEWQTLAFDRAGAPLEISVPALSDAQMAALAARVREARRQHL